MSKKIKYLMITWMLITAPIFLGAQEISPQKIKVPLTNPSKPGTLKISINIGDIYVEGYSGKEIDIETTVKTKKIASQTCNCRQTDLEIERYLELYYVKL